MHKLTQEEWQAWWDSPMTRRLREALRLKAERHLSDLKDSLWTATLGSPEQWAFRQPSAAGEAKFADALRWVADDLTLGDIQDEEDDA